MSEHWIQFNYIPENCYFIHSLFTEQPIMSFDNDTALWFSIGVEVAIEGNNVVYQNLVVRNTGIKDQFVPLEHGKSAALLLQMIYIGSQSVLPGRIDRHVSDLNIFHAAFALYSGEKAVRINCTGVRNTHVYLI